MILCVRTQSAAFYSGHSGQSPLVLNHIEPRYKDKVGSVSRGRLFACNPTVIASAFVVTDRRCTALGGILSRIAHHQFRHVWFQQVVQPGGRGSFFNVTCKSPRSPSINCRIMLAFVSITHSITILRESHDLARCFARRVYSERFVDSLNRISWQRPICPECFPLAAILESDSDGNRLAAAGRAARLCLR